MATLKYFDTTAGVWKLLQQGPRGDKGDTGVSTFVRVHHGNDANTPRADAIFVEWVGSVEPLNGTIQDTWIDTA